VNAGTGRHDAAAGIRRAQFRSGLETLFRDASALFIRRAAAGARPAYSREITQAVFIILAQKAGRISEKTILTAGFSERRGLSRWRNPRPCETPATRTGGANAI